MSNKLTAAITLSALSLAACAKKEAAPAPAAPAPTAVMQPVANVKQVMLGIVIPASDILFGVAASAPADDTAWAKVQANAVVLAEAAKLLTDSSRKRDDAEWITKAQALYDTANAAAAAAAEKNAEKTSDAGNAVYDACDGCHMKYMPARQGESSNPAQ